MISRSDLNFLFCFIGVDSELIEVKKEEVKWKRQILLLRLFAFHLIIQQKQKLQTPKI